MVQVGGILVAGTGCVIQGGLLESLAGFWDDETREFEYWLLRFARQFCKDWEVWFGRDFCLGCGGSSIHKEIELLAITR